MEATKMLLAKQNQQVIKNYAIAITCVMLASVGIADLFKNPVRVAQQNRLDNYGRYVGVGIVSFAQKSFPQ
jgi:hypothetical protein